MTSQRNVGETREGVDAMQADGGDVVAEIVTAVADSEGVDPTELDRRLYEAIDPDALTTLVDDAPESGLTIGFDYTGYRVTVVADEEDTHIEVVPQR